MIHVHNLADAPWGTRVAVSSGGGWDCYGAGDAHPQAPVPTHEEMARLMATPYADAVQAMLDAAAQARAYDGILSMVSYAGDTHPKFGSEGAAAKAWRTACWSRCYSILAAVESGARPMPTVADLLAEMPMLAV